MEDRFKERISAALMGDFLVALAKREKLKELFGEMDGWDADRLIDDLLSELEQIVEKKLRGVPTAEEPSASGAERTPTSGKPAAAGVSPPVEPKPEAPKPFSFSKLFGTGTEMDALGLAGELAAAAREILGQSFPATPSPEIVESAAAKEPAEASKDAGVEEKVPPEKPPETLSEAPSPAAEYLPPPVEPVQKPKPPKVHHEFSDEDFVYVHGVTFVPDDEPPSSRPFMLKEKGIEDKDFAFAIDHRGLRFYLSKIHTRSSNVSKSGILLLNKQESIAFRGRHESMLNEFRCHGVLLPFEFGTVVRGKESLLGKIDDHLTDLHLAVEDISGTTWWEVSVYALDTRFAQALAIDVPARGQRERVRSGIATGTSSKLDIKTLDRILGKQKKIAEMIHEELSAVAVRSDVDMKISLGGGTSEDWKQILKASYEVPPPRFPAFIRVVTEIQYRQVMSDIMMAVTGEREPFSFQA